MKRWRGGGWAVVLALLLANPAWAERVALVIGNDAYRHGGALNNAVGDARKVGDALERLGFRVLRKQNLGYTGLLDALDELGQAAAGAEWAVVYYAGHAIQVQGRNYLLPVDVALNREGDLRRAVLLDDLLNEVNQARDLGLVILDACRDNPFAARLNQGAGRSVAGRGLARVGQTGGNTLVAFATREDTIAADSGLYASVLVEHLATPGLEVRQLFGQVRDAVMARTGNQQQPFTYGSLGGGHYAFKPGAAAAPPPATRPETPSPPADHDLIAWQSAEKCGTAACFEAYLEDYPKGRYARMAKARLKPAESTHSTASRPPAIASTAPEERPRPSRLTEGTIKIAVAGPITGPVAQYGDMQMSGAKMAVEQLNAKGGVNGKKLEVVLMDDVCEPKQAVAIANQIVNQKIRYVVGHLCSGSTQPASKIYEDEGILMITPGATNPAITQQGYRMVFRSIGTDDQQGSIAGQYIAGMVKPRKLAIIHDKRHYGESIAKEVYKTVKAAGITPVLFEGINTGQTDFSALITKMKTDRVDFVYYGGFHPELGLLLRQSRDQGFYANYMGPEGVGNRDISAIAGQASEGLLVTLPADFCSDPANAALVKAFNRKNQDPCGPFVMPAYAAIQIIVEAIRGTQTEDPIKLADYIRRNSFETSIGPVAFKNNGDLKEFKFVIFSWHSDATKSLVR